MQVCEYTADSEYALHTTDEFQSYYGLSSWNYTLVILTVGMVG